MAEIAATLRGINHRWPSSGVTACRNISLDLHSGSLHALVGENGAGKTTLGLILAGVLKPDSGSIQLGTREVSLKKKSMNTSAEIALIRQRNIWPSVLTVREAAVLGRYKKPVRIKDQINAFNQTAEDWKLEGINPEILISGMDAASLQKAEMIAALMFNPKILVLDEPSSAWEEGRGKEFYHLIEQLKAAGRAVLLITHRLEDVFSMADKVTVMRHGSVVGSWDVEDTDYSLITRGMFGEEPEYNKTILIPDSVFSSVISRIEARGIGVKKSEKGILDGIDFQLHPGEILGITGLREEGLSVLEDIISGNRKPDRGSLLLDNRSFPSNPSDLRKSGLHYVPSDKTGRGSSLSSTLTENMIILETQNLSRKGWFLQGKIRNWIEERRIEGGISGNPDQKLEELSGGNIQKVILLRELNKDSHLLVVADPTWGLDEKSRRIIHAKIRELRNQGTAVLLLASDLDEALSLSDRMGIISRGRLSRIKKVLQWNRNEAAQMIAGIEKKAVSL